MKYSKITYTYTGGDRVFPIPFDYLDKDYIHIYINSIELDKNKYEIDEQSVIVNSNLEAGDLLSVERNTDLKKLVDFTGRNDLKSYDLNLALTQVLHVMQEEKDSIVEIMPQTPSGDWDATGKRLCNLAPAVDSSDAVRKDQINRLSWDGMEKIEDDVNYLLSAEATKGKADGYAPLDSETLIPKNYIPHFLSPLPPFSVNSGKLDENGYPAILSLAENTITANAPFTYTTAAGYTYTQTSDLLFDITAFTSGTYNIFINPETQSLEIYKNKIIYQNSAPVYEENIVWLNNGIMPPVSFLGKNESFEITSLVPLGYFEKEPAPIEPEPEEPVEVEVPKV